MVALNHLSSHNPHIWVTSCAPLERLHIAKAAEALIRGNRARDFGQWAGPDFGHFLSPKNREKYGSDEIGLKG